MPNELLIATIAGLAGMFGWGFADFFAKKTIDKVGDIVTLTWAHVYGVITILSLLFARSMSKGELPTVNLPASELGVIALFGVLQAFVYFFVYRAFGKGKLSLLNPIFSSYSGFVVLLSVLVFGEVVGQLQLAVLVVVFLGILSLSLDKESFKIKRVRWAKLPGLKDILMAVVMAAAWTLLWGKFIAGKDWLLYATLMYVVMSVTILLIALVQRVKLNVLNSYTWKYFLLIGLAEVIAYVGVSVGYSLTSHISIVAVLSAAFSLPTLVLAYLFLGERVNIYQFFGLVLVVAGVALLPVI